MSDQLQSFLDFMRAVGERLEAGSREYGDKSFAREPGELLGELQQEALDLAGWGYVLWRRLETMREAVGEGASIEAPTEAPNSETNSGCSRCPRIRAAGDLTG